LSAIAQEEDVMTESEIHAKFSKMTDHLNEHSKRLWCANEALAFGWGGLRLVAKATGALAQQFRLALTSYKGFENSPLKGSDAPVADEKKSRIQIQTYLMTWKSWLLPSHGAIQNRHSGGSARVFGSWRTS
jgi:hypothetical protein